MIKNKKKEIKKNIFKDMEKNDKKINYRIIKL